MHNEIVIQDLAQQREASWLFVWVQFVVVCRPGECLTNEYLQTDEHGWELRGIKHTITYFFSRWKTTLQIKRISGRLQVKKRGEKCEGNSWEKLQKKWKKKLNKISSNLNNLIFENLKVFFCDYYLSSLNKILIYFGNILKLLFIIHSYLETSLVYFMRFVSFPSTFSLGQCFSTFLGSRHT